MNNYYRLDYLQSNGAQYIDTGFKPNQDTRINANIQALSLDGWMMGSRTDYDIKAFGISLNYNGNSLDFWNYGNGFETPSQIFSTSEFVDVDLNKNELYKNGTLVSTRPSQTFQNDYNAYLFNANLSGNLATGSPSKWKWCKIYDNGTLIRDFVPAMRKSDSVVGYYDQLNDVFYTNAGSGTFTYGNILYEVSASGDHGTVTGTGYYPSGTSVTLTAVPSSGYKFNRWKLNGYTRLEYIESTGTQYINTGVTASSGMTFKTECMFTSTSGRGTVLATSSNYSPWISREYLRPTVATKTVSVDLSLNVYHNIEVNETNAIVDDTTYEYTTNPDVSVGGSIWLFRRNDGGYYGLARIKSLSIEKNGSYLRNFVPVKRDSDDAIGLLDLVNMEFYGNSGSGTFTAGDEFIITDNPLTFTVTSDVDFTVYFDRTSNCFVKVNGEWKQGMLYRKDTTWKETEVFVKNGTWKK